MIKICYNILSAKNSKILRIRADTDVRLGFDVEQIHLKPAHLMDSCYGLSGHAVPFLLLAPRTYRYR